MEIEGQIGQAITAYEQTLALWKPERPDRGFQATQHRLQVLGGVRNDGVKRVSEQQDEPVEQ